MKNYFSLLLFVALFLTACTVPDIEDKKQNPLEPKTETTETKENVTEKPAPEIENTDAMSPEEAAFNASGRAKAIESETDLWNLYENAEVGFSFQYPHDVTLTNGNEATESEKLSLSVEIKEIGEVEAPGDLDMEESQKNIEALSAGNFGSVSDFALEASQQVKSVGFLFAQDYLVLSRFEVCNVTLERKLSFYFNNKYITLTFQGPVEKLIETMPEYFVENAENCGDLKIWDFEKQDAFYKALAEGNGSAEIQSWFQTFEQIAESITFAHR